MINPQNIGARDLGLAKSLGAVSLYNDSLIKLGHRRPLNKIFRSYNDLINYLNTKDNKDPILWIFSDEWSPETRNRDISLGGCFPFMEVFSTDLAVTPESIEEHWSDEIGLEALKRLRELTEDYQLKVEWTSECQWALQPTFMGTLCSTLGCFCEVTGWYIYRLK